jgi:hypothetical protein
MNEIVARENNRKEIEDTKEAYLNPADWKISSDRRELLQNYQNSLENAPVTANIGASRYEKPSNTEYDLTKVSKSLGIRCLQLKTDRFSHKVPVDRMLKNLELARPHDNPSEVFFPYGFTENNKFNITNVIMPLETYKALSKEISSNFENNSVYNQE